VIYLAGFGVQFAGENYYVPVDAELARDVDVPLQAVRISDFAQHSCCSTHDISILTSSATTPRIV